MVARGACVVARGGIRGCSGVCVWLLWGGMRGCSRGTCMVALGGGGIHGSGFPLDLENLEK